MGKVAADGDDFLPDRLRPIASITKSFTAVGILQLMEAGKIFLNQPVSSIIKEFDTDMHRHITIFQLLTHTSGLKSGSGCYFEPYPEEWDDDLTKENWIRKTLSGPLQYKPGTRWSYCSMGYAILAEIIARVSGKDYGRHIEESIFQPLGMESTFFFVPGGLRHKVCSVSGWNDWMLGWKREENGLLSLLGSGSIFSTAHDLCKFGQMIVNGGTFNGQKILGRKSVEAAIRPQVNGTASRG